jgi:hypothetical protein
LVFLSGVGFERLLARDREGLPGLRRAASGLFVLCLGLAALSAAAVLDEEIVEVLIEAIAPEFSRSPLRSSLALVSDLLGISSLFAGLAGLSFGLVASAPRAAPAGLLLVLLLHPLDLLGWKFRSEWLATLSAGPDPELRHRIGDLPFRARRELQEEIQRRKSASEERARRSDLILRRSGYAGAWTLEDVSDGPAPFGLRAAPGPAPSRKIRFYQGEATPSGPEMADLPHRVTRFGADDLEVQVATAPEGAWMTYSDAWATGWDGAVNGARVPVHRVDGVKAVRLEPGQNVIRLSYRSRLRSWGGLLMGVPALAGLASLIWIVVRMGRHEAAE